MSHPSIRFATLLTTALSWWACSPESTEGPQGSGDDADAVAPVAIYDYVGPAAIQSSAPSGRFQIAELDTSFPIQSSDIQLWLQQEFDDNAVVRSHAWSTWGALTTLTSYPIENPNGTQLGATLLPAFATWYSSYELYGVNSDANATCTATQGPSTDPNGIKRCRAGSLVDFNKFASMETTYINDRSFNDRATLTARLQNPTPMDLPPFVASGFEQNTTSNVSFSLKPVFYLLKNNAHNLLPYWGGMQAGTTSDVATPTPNTWNQCVLVTIGTPTASPPTTCNPGSGNANAPEPGGGWQSVGLSEFFSLPLTQQTLDEINYMNEQSQAKTLPIQPPSILSLGDSATTTPEAGDVAVLVGMHVAVRETQDWTWQTFYWSPTNLQQVAMNTAVPTFPPKTTSYVAGPNYPGSSSDNPWGRSDDSAGSVPTWAKNYAMCTAYAEVYPVQPRNGGTNTGTLPQICFNPWLETAFTASSNPGHFSSGGLNSNCMTCHGQASYRGAVTTTATCSLPQGFGYYMNGYIPRDNTCLTNANYDYDFSWHLANAYAPPSSDAAANPNALHQKPPRVALSFSQE